MKLSGLVEIVFTKELVGDVERLANGQYDLRRDVFGLTGEDVTVVVRVGVCLCREGKVVQVVLVLAHVVDVLYVIIEQRILFDF
jgi:hypothetical protein